MRRDGYDVRTIYDDRDRVAGYVWRKRGRTAWGALLVGFCECCAPEKRLGSFPHGDDGFYMLCEEPEYSLPFKVWGYYDLEGCTLIDNKRKYER